MLYAAIINKLDTWLWLGYGLIISDSIKNNFDIYLPEWLAMNNKLIYTLILIVVICITA
jgi:hypothetical protein